MAETEAPTKRGSAKKRKPEGLRDRYSVAFIGVTLGVPERTTHNILTRAGLKDGGTGCQFDLAANAVVQDLLGQLESVDKDMLADKAAKLKAERTSAEVDAARKLDEVLFKADVETIWADKWARMRVFIESFPDLDADGRRSLVDGLLSIGLAEPLARDAT